MALKADCDVVVIGAGFAGLYAAYRFREQGLSVQGFEAAADVGGVWYHNRYPGARCDVESIDYSYSFSNELQQEWLWSEKYAGQPEILAYLEHVAERFDLRRHFRFSTKVTAAHRRDGLWHVTSDAGGTVTSRFVVLATGCLSEPKPLPFAGLDDFAGEWYRTSHWPKEGVDLAGKRVGLIGTGSTGLQCAPEVAKVAKHLHVFQRTPVFSTPARNGPLDPDYYADIRARYPEIRRENLDTRGATSSRGTGKSAAEFDPELRQQMMQEQWAKGGLGLTLLFTDTLKDEAVNAEVAGFVRSKIGEIVKDPEVAAKLMPWDHPISSRRICIDSDYYATYNRPNVSLVDLREGEIERITPEGIRTAQADYPLDVIIFALGFDAVTGAAAAIDIRNEAGENLGETWQANLETYLGLMTAGFPNLFAITGPLSPSVLANMVPGIEHDVDWIGECIAHLDGAGLREIEALPEAQREWTEHVADISSRTLYPKARSWYMGDNIAGKQRKLYFYVGGFNTYTAKVREVTEAGYAGFRLS